MKAETRQYISKAFPEEYGRFIDCGACSMGGPKTADSEKLVFKYIRVEDDEAVYVECPECGRGGKFEKPIGRRGVRILIQS